MARPNLDELTDGQRLALEVAETFQVKVVPDPSEAGRFVLHVRSRRPITFTEMNLDVRVAVLDEEPTHPDRPIYPGRHHRHTHAVR
jgi:hypothetical protein